MTQKITSCRAGLRARHVPVLMAFGGQGRPPYKAQGRPQYRAFWMCLCVLVVGFLVSCKKEKSETPAAQSQPNKYNVVLISIDTLRADYLKLYQPDGTETPNLEELARTGILFERTVSQVPYTLPSHCTMLTGLYPPAHAVRDNVRDVLPEEIPTIPALFQKAGYQTAGFAGSMVLSRQTGLARGFDYYDDSFSRADVHAEDLGAIERSAEDVFHSFSHWFNKRDSKRNFFAFLHFYDPHSPYNPPARFSPKQPSLQELYKGEIRYVDSVLGELFSALKTAGIWNNTIVIVTSDHGEMLNEHQETGHGFFLYQPALEVPLIVSAPGLIQPGKVSALVELVDVTPTALELAQLQRPSGMHGESLVALMKKKANRKRNNVAFAESYFASLQFGTSPQSSVQDDKYKFIETPKPELYDLKGDPAESKNLVASQKSTADKFKQMLGQYRGRFQKTAKNEERSVTAEEAEKFAALGYLGGSIPEQQWDLSKDPKDYIDDWNRSLEASFLLSQGQYSKALSLIKTLRAQGGSSTLAVMEAKCHLALGDPNQAERTLKNIGDSPEAVSALADLYRRTKRIKQADDAYQKVLKTDFSFFALYNYLIFLRDNGRSAEAVALLEKTRNQQPLTEQAESFYAEAYFMLRDLDTAEKFTLHQVESRPWELKWSLQLAGIYQAKNQIQKAIDFLRTKQNSFALKPDYFLHLGILYRHSNRPAQEVESYKQMIRVDPRDPRGYFYLAKTVLDLKGDPLAVIQLAQQGFRLQPDPNMQILGHYVLSDAYAAAGKNKESQQELQRAQQLEKMYG